MTVISVFGNETEKSDSLAVRLVPKLQRRLPEVEFRLVDPSESLEPASDPWPILDVGTGITEVVMIQDLKQLDLVKGSSVHDFDVYLDLRLREKLGQLPRIKIILIPSQWTEDKAITKVDRIIRAIISAQK